MAKSSRSKNVIPFTERRNPDLHGYCYLPLDRRKQGNVDLLHGVCHRQRGHLDDYEMNDLPASDFERGYMT